MRQQAVPKHQQLNLQPRRLGLQVCLEHVQDRWPPNAPRPPESACHSTPRQHLIVCVTLNDTHDRGSDTALLRVTMVDANGNLVSTSSANVTFDVVSGPGRVFDIANGDPALQTQPHASTVSTYLGLARGFVQVTWDCTTPNRDIASTVDVDGNKRTIIKADGDCAATPIVVKVTAGSLGSATVSILVSSDVEKDSPVAVAKANVNLDTWAYTDIQA